MSDVRILALETATDACSAAISINGEVRERFEVAPRRHVALLLPFVDSLLADAGLSVRQLDAVAFGRGPGSFTGLRIAAGMAQGIAFGAGLPVVPVSTLAALAQYCARERGAAAVLAALDARMQEVYFGAFRMAADGLMVAAGEEVVCAPAGVPVPPAADWYAAGDGWCAHGEPLRARLPFKLAGLMDTARPHAADVARLAAVVLSRGGALAPEQAAPVYLRNHVADKPGSRV
jgi:tRNA threonylcarbamoyladenosine biosynthesis protein TsaB